MGTEQRIRAQRKSMRGFAHEYGVSAMWMSLARQWRRPVQEIKRICHGPDWDPAVKREHDAKIRADIAERFDKVRALIAEGRKAEAHELLQCCREGRRCER